MLHGNTRSPPPLRTAPPASNRTFSLEPRLFPALPPPRPVCPGLSAVFRAGLTVLQLLEPRLLALGDEATTLPLLLRVPVDV